MEDGRLKPCRHRWSESTHGGPSIRAASRTPDRTTLYEMDPDVDSGIPGSRRRGMSLDGPLSAPGLPRLLWTHSGRLSCDDPWTTRLLPSDICKFIIMVLCTTKKRSSFHFFNFFYFFWKNPFRLDDILSLLEIFFILFRFSVSQFWFVPISFIKISVRTSESFVTYPRS